DTEHRLDIVHDGKSAIRQFAAVHYDVVLMDVHMPAMDGYTATRAIRSLEAERKAARTPIIAVTADAYAESIDRALRSGCDGHLSKPIIRSALLETLGRFAKAAEREIVEVDDLLGLIPRYLENRRRDLGAMKEALERGDFDLIWTLGHNLKGT